MSQSIYNLILGYLKSERKWHWGGSLARSITRLADCKEATAERRCRELAETGKIKRDWVKIKGRQRMVKSVKYKI